MNKEKRIYSLTEAAYLITEGCEDYKINRDEIDANKCYFVFPDNQQVQDIINVYKNTKIIYVDLKKYNAAYKKIRQAIYNKRSEDDFNG